MHARDFSRIFSEIVLCSRKPPNVFERKLGVRVQTVTLYHNLGLTPWMSLDQVFDTFRDQRRREYRGPVEIRTGSDSRCPYCGNPQVYECLTCGVLWCCGFEQEHQCELCKAVGPVNVAPGPLLEPEPYAAPTLRARIWNAWIDFNEWVYERMTRKGRPEAIHEAAAEFRKRSKP